MIPRFTAPELEIFLETSGKIALDIFAASVADAAGNKRAQENDQLSHLEHIVRMRRCFSTSVRYLSHENPLVRLHGDDFGGLLSST
jgi:hypothetical protein